MSALVHRHLTGHGQMIDVSMLETMLSLTAAEVQAAQFPVPPPGRPMFGPVRTKDGYIMPAIASERTFQGLCRAAERLDWLEDERFAAYPDRRNNWGQLIDELEAWSTTRSTIDCQAAFDREGVPNSPYRTVREVMNDPQLAHRQSFAEVTDQGGTFKVLNPPFRMSDSAVQVAGFAAALGEHTETMLAEVGFTAPEIAAMVSAGIAGAKSRGTSTTG
jgi:crotonobetainyl-CoA:carnitine CoA-transferase CaiB-like acyl-CoA transferase